MHEQGASDSGRVSKMGYWHQFFRMLLVFLKLKGWRFIFMLLVLVAASSNIFLFEPLDSWMLRFGEQDLQVVGAKEYQRVIIVLGNVAESELQFEIMADAVKLQTGMDFKSSIERCNAETDCQEKYFQLLAGIRSGKHAHFVDFKGKNNKAKLRCQITTGTELYCPISAYLVGLAQQEEKNAYYQFNQSYAFRLISTIKTYSNVPGGNNTICKKNLNYSTIFPKTLMVQMLFVIGALGFYLLVCTVATIYELKQSGFLQLVFRKEMSVLAYWLALWLITVLEMATFAAALTLSYYIHCPGFYSTPKLINVFLSVLLQFCCAAAFVLLSTVVTQSIVIATLIVCILYVVAAVFVIANRIFFSSPDSSAIVRCIFLVIPFGNIAEQVHEILLKGYLPKNTLISFVLPASASMLVLASILTIYLDSVLTFGNGRKLPLFYFFNRRFWGLGNSDNVQFEHPEDSVMVEEASEMFQPVLHVVKLVKNFKPYRGGAWTEALKDFSVRFYQDQITAVVGHNGSGKSTLMQILSGAFHATQGGATLNSLLITDPLYRCHVGNDIGYCPQADALVDRLTVQDTLKLAAASSGFSWDDISLDVQTVLSTLLIEDKLSHYIYSLSSGDKRKVCVTIALIGKPRVVLLDSPSTDMDFISKRRMWKLLHEYKIGRTIIFSTLFMDEASGMADRMMFLSGGRLICAGSSYFFKRAFDCRYIIQVASRTEFHVPFIIRKVVSKFSTVRVRSISSADLELEVSIMEDDILPAVALEIESMSELIEEFGIAQYSLDDVFFKLKGLTPAEVQRHFESSSIGYVADDVDRMKQILARSKPNPSNSPALVEVDSSKLRTIVALMAARFLETRRSKVNLIIRVIVPTLLLLLLLCCAFLERGMKNDQKNITIDLSATDTFEAYRGACLAHASLNQSREPHLEKILDTDCDLMLTGMNSTIKPNLKVVDLLEEKGFKVGDFEQAILSSHFLTDVGKLCKGASGPCPLIYSSNWCPNYGIVRNHRVYVGSYVNRINYDPTNVSMTAIEIYKNAFSRVSNKYKGFENSTVSTNKSLMPDIDVKGIQEISGIFFSFYALFIQIALLAVIPGICLNDVVQDKISGVRTQLLSMSVTRLHYWICTFITHWIQLALVYIVSVVLLVAIASPGYRQSFYLVAVFLPTLTLGLVNSLLCVYVVSSLVSTVSYLIIIIYSAFSLMVSMSVLLVQSSDELTRILIYVFPQYAIIAPTFFGARFIHYTLSFYRISKDQPNLLPYLFRISQTRDALIAMVIHLVLLLLLFIVLENRKTMYASWCRKSATDNERHTYDNCTETTIVEEAKKIAQQPKDSRHMMEINQLQVKTRQGKVLINDLTFGLKFGETFGLLSPCGSGTSAALKAMVGETLPSAGRVDYHVKDRWLSCESAVMEGFVGYCPKNDPLFQRLTVRENLVFYARAVGVSLERVQQTVRNLQLEYEVNTVAMCATAAVKRRLTLAIAVLAGPRILFIDQATAGVDPEGRQIIWQTIKSQTDQERGMLVVTQFIEEAETLCGRICILNAGMMAALNTIDELICRYKKMYFIEIQIGHIPEESDAACQIRKEAILKAVLGKFYGCLVIEQMTLRLQFGVPIRSIGCLSSALTWLVEKKKAFHFQYFSIHYATIDQTMKAIVVHRETLMLKRQEGKEHAPDVKV